MSTTALQRRTSGILLLLALQTVATVAAADGGVPDPAERYAEAIRRAAYTPSTDDAFLLLQSVAPGFAGLYQDAEGAVMIGLAEHGSAEQAKQVVADLWVARADQAGEAPTVPELRIAAARLDWNALLEHRDTMAGVADFADLVSLDADERCNCVRLGIADGRATDAVLEFAHATGVPSWAIAVEVHPRATFAQAITDPLRPIPGGVQVEHRRRGSQLGWQIPPIVGVICTATAAAELSGSAGLLVASHCSPDFASVDASPVYQNRYTGSSTAVAVEAVDPPLDRNLPGCRSGRLCRFSDAAFAAGAPRSLDFHLGWIARTAGHPCSAMPCADPLAMRSTNDRLGITRVGAAPLAGATMTKIGRVTGATTGTVSATCVDVDVDPLPTTPRNVTLLCQSILDAEIQPGDSGAPVVADHGPSTVALEGMAWGTVGATQATFTPIGLVARELGGLQFMQNPLPPPRPSRPAYCERARNLCKQEIGLVPGVTQGYCQREYNGCMRSGIP